MFDPLIEKQKNEAAKLSRRRQVAADASKDIITRREAFFDRLALINGGALTFSVTLLGSTIARTPHAKELLFVAWFLLLLSLTACLSRNITHQHYQMADALARMADAEITYIDVDYEIVSTRAVMYSDSPEPFDKQGEIVLNRSNREQWKKAYEDQHRKAERYWRVLIGSEWTSGVGMILGFGFLVAFALRNL